jgi:hypothetical protein
MMKKKPVRRSFGKKQQSLQEFKKNPRIGPFKETGRKKAEAPGQAPSTAGRRGRPGTGTGGDGAGKRDPGNGLSFLPQRSIYRIP